MASDPNYRKPFLVGGVSVQDAKFQDDLKEALRRSASGQNEEKCPEPVLQPPAVNQPVQNPQNAFYPMLPRLHMSPASVPAVNLVQRPPAMVPVRVNYIQPQPLSARRPQVQHFARVDPSESKHVPKNVNRQLSKDPAGRPAANGFALGAEPRSHGPLPRSLRNSSEGQPARRGCCFQGRRSYRALDSENPQEGRPAHPPCRRRRKCCCVFGLFHVITYLGLLWVTACIAWKVHRLVEHTWESEDALQEIETMQAQMMAQKSIAEKVVFVNVADSALSADAWEKLTESFRNIEFPDLTCFWPDHKDHHRRLMFGSAPSRPSTPAPIEGVHKPLLTWGPHHHDQHHDQHGPGPHGPPPPPGPGSAPPRPPHDSSSSDSHEHHHGRHGGPGFHGHDGRHGPPATQVPHSGVTIGDEAIEIDLGYKKMTIGKTGTIEANVGNARFYTPSFKTVEVDTDDMLINVETDNSITFAFALDCFGPAMPRDQPGPASLPPNGFGPNRGNGSSDDARDDWDAQDAGDAFDGAFWDDALRPRDDGMAASRQRGIQTSGPEWVDLSTPSTSPPRPLLGADEATWGPPLVDDFDDGTDFVYWEHASPSQEEADEAMLAPLVDDFDDGSFRFPGDDGSTWAPPLVDDFAKLAKQAADAAPALQQPAGATLSQIQQLANFSEQMLSEGLLAPENELKQQLAASLPAAQHQMKTFMVQNTDG